MNKIQTAGSLKDHMELLCLNIRAQVMFLPQSSRTRYYKLSHNEEAHNGLTYIFNLATYEPTDRALSDLALFDETLPESQHLDETSALVLSTCASSRDVHVKSDRTPITSQESSLSLNTKITDTSYK